MIPEAAVEAAAEALCRAVWDTTWDMVHENQRHVFREDARKALEAAAPHMLAGLRAELVRLAKEFDTAEGGTLAYTAILDGRYGMRKNAHDQLMYIVENYLDEAKWLNR